MSELSRPMFGRDGHSSPRVTFQRRANQWSSEDLRTLRALAETGTAPDMIAVTLRRTESAVRNKAGMHGISLRAKPQTGG